MALVTDFSIACFIGAFILFTLIISRYWFIVIIAAIVGAVMMYKEHRERVMLDRMTDRAIHKALKKVFQEEQPLILLDINGKKWLERIQ